MRWELPKWLRINQQSNARTQPPEPLPLPPTVSDSRPAPQRIPEISPEIRATAATIFKLVGKNDPRASSWLTQMGIDLTEDPNMEEQIAKALAKNRALRREINRAVAKNGSQERDLKVNAPRAPITNKPLSEIVIQKAEPKKTVTVAFGDKILVQGNNDSQEALARYVFGIIKDKKHARGIAKKIAHLSEQPGEISAFMTQFVHEHALPPGADTTIEYAGYRIFIAIEYADGGAINAIKILSSSGARGNLYSKTKDGNGARG